MEWASRHYHDGDSAGDSDSLCAEPQQQVVDAVQLEVEVLELGVEVVPVRQAALCAHRRIDLRHRFAAVDLGNDAGRQRRQLRAPREAVEVGDQRRTGLEAGGEL